VERKRGKREGRERGEIKREETERRRQRKRVRYYK
jgi:hypothetical protein